MLRGTPHFYSLIWYRSQVVKLVELHHGKKLSSESSHITVIFKIQIFFFVYFKLLTSLTSQRLFSDTASVSNLSTCLSVFFRSKLTLCEYSRREVVISFSQQTSESSEPAYIGMRDRIHSLFINPCGIFQWQP